MIRGLAALSLIKLVIIIAACKDESIPQAAMDNGKKVYKTYCLSCHMEDAAGVPGLNPPLVNSALLLNDKAKTIRIVLKGSDELKDEPDRDYKNSMAALSHLSDQQIADVLTFTRNSFGNKAPKITANEVKNERAKLK